jgi:hypothetical protein
MLFDDTARGQGRAGGGRASARVCSHGFRVQNNWGEGEEAEIVKAVRYAETGEGTFVLWQTVVHTRKGIKKVRIFSEVVLGRGKGGRRG